MFHVWFLESFTDHLRDFTCVKMIISNILSVSTADNICFSALGESTSFPMWQRSLYWYCVQQSWDCHGWRRWQDHRLQSRPRRSVSSHRLDKEFFVHIEMPTQLWCNAEWCDSILLLMFTRECRQQHYSCCGLPSDNRDIDCKLYRSTEVVGF